MSQPNSQASSQPDSPAESQAPVAPSSPQAAAEPAGKTVAPPALPAGRRGAPFAVWLALAVLLALLGAVAWWLNARLYATQAEIARRLQAAQMQAVEARALANQEVAVGRELTARIAVLEAREQDLASQRQALQQMVQDLARTRDDAVLGQTGELIALAQQQAQLSGNVQPLINTLHSTQVRLKRVGGSRASLLLRAVEADLTRLQGSSVPDIPGAAQRLDQLAVLIGQLQTVASAAPLRGPSQAAQPASQLPAAGWGEWTRHWTAAAWQQLRQLVSVTRMDHPEALLLSPQQTEDLRANLKLRVLNARLDLLSRNAAGYRDDMRDIQRTLHTYFNPHQARTAMAVALAAQAAQIDLALQPERDLQSLSVLAGFGLGAE